MKLLTRQGRGMTAIAVFCLVICLLSACSMVGPQSIIVGREKYNEAINKTEDEQLLRAIVKGRYGETFSLLSVNNIAANLRFRTNVGAEFGVGPDNNYTGNLVPLSGGVAYEENPTISYTPVRGEVYLRQLMSPISLEIMVLMTRAGESWSDYFFAVFADRVNGLKNPIFLGEEGVQPDMRFYRFITLFDELDGLDVVQWVVCSREGVRYDILIKDYAPDHLEQVREFLDLLDLPMPKDESKEILLPVYFGIRAGPVEGIAISTRSTFELIEIMRAAIDVPEEHVESGLAIDYPELRFPGGSKGIRIRVSDSEPETAALAIQHHDHWFYIEETDVRTKYFYSLIRMLWSVSIAAGSDQSAAPVLTIPVSN